MQKLNNWYLLVCGMISALILIILSILSIITMRNFRTANISADNYKQSLMAYSKGKIQFVRFQKLSIYLGAILMLAILPVMGQLIAGKDLFIETRLWMWYVVGYLLFYPFSKWVFKSYLKTTADAESILKELEN
jgi:NADH:ubiquinone oxidoreductase subunit 6 (subunit J)